MKFRHFLTFADFLRQWEVILSISKGEMATFYLSDFKKGNHIRSTILAHSDSLGFQSQALLCKLAFVQLQKITVVLDNIAKNCFEYFDKTFLNFAFLGGFSFFTLFYF